MNIIEYYSKIDKYKENKAIKENDSLQHYGIIGQKWGNRRWQNPDGTFNEAGKERYFGKNGSTKKNVEDKIGKSTEFKYRMNNGNMFNLDYQNSDGSLTKKGEKALKRAQKHPKWFTTKNLIDEDLLHEWEKSMTKDQFKTDSDKEKENKDNEIRERVQKLDNEIITDKYPKSSNKLTDEEFDKIAKDLEAWDEDFHSGKTDKHSNTLVADLGINALNKSRGEGYAEVGDNADREWFMWEDQTIGLPDIAYLYTKGYSKDYIKGMLNYKNEYELSDDEYEKFRDKYPETSFIMYEYHDGDKYIDGLFELKDQKSKNEIPKTTNDVKIKWNVADNMKEHQDEINEEVQKVLTKAIQNNPNNDAPTDMTVDVDSDGHFKIDFKYDNTPKIGNMYDLGFKIQRNSQGGYMDKTFRKQFADSIKRNRDQVDAKNLTDDEIDEIVNNRIKATSDKDLIAEFNIQSLRYQLEKQLNTKFGSTKKSNSKANNWDYFNEAVAKLGLDNKEKLSDADWDKINKEILKMKK